MSEDSIAENEVVVDGIAVRKPSGKLFQKDINRPEVGKNVDIDSTKGEEREKPFVVVENLPNLEDLPASSQEKVDERGRVLEETIESLEDVRDKLSAQKKAQQQIAEQLRGALDGEAGSDNRGDQATELARSIRDNISLSATASSKLREGKDASSELKIDDVRFRDIRKPRNLGDLVVRLKSRSDYRSQNRKDNFMYAQWNKVDDLRRGMSRSIGDQITSLNDVEFPDLELGFDPITTKEVIEKVLPVYVQSTTTLKSDLALLARVAKEVDSLDMPTSTNKHGDEVDLKGEVLSRLNREVESREKALEHIAKDLGRTNKRNTARTETNWAVRDLLHTAAVSCDVEGFTRGEVRGSNEAYSTALRYSTVTAEQYSKLQKVVEAANSIVEFQPHVSEHIEVFSATIQAIERYARLNYELPNSDGLLVHGMSVDTFRQVFESQILGSRSYVFEKTGEANYRTAMLRVEKNDDDTYTVHDDWADISETIDTMEELGSVTGQDNKRWFDEYNQLCFSANRTYMKMFGRGIFLAVGRGDMLTEYQFADDDGLHLFNREHSGEDPKPFTLDMSDTSYLVLVPEEDASSFTEMVNSIPDETFERFGGREAWLSSHVSVHKSIDQDMPTIRERYKSNYPPRSSKRGVMVPSGVIEDRLIVRNNVPLVKYMTRQSDKRVK